ncbi:MAG: tRNA pseudouridine(38-40) synthase TruA [Bacteroidales bacterium]|nr:tRNA pseudouridine(38-40) synthase TruA [Bacteroidales bacterium]
MKTRYLIQLAYDGTAYVGWQIQPNGMSVQEKLQNALSLLLREEVKVVGCGRTDTGVHASYFVAHIDLDTVITDAPKLLYKLNGFLPKDIVLFDIKEASKDFHARFGATERSYEYHLVTRKSPFLSRYSYRPNSALDFEAMNKAAQHLLEVIDFTSFSKLHSDAFTNNCDVREAVWKQKDEYHWVFHISADRFLRNMVRAVVGTLLEVGKGKITEKQFCAIIAAKDRGKAGISVPGAALFLTNVHYPEVYIKR